MRRRERNECTPSSAMPDSKTGVEISTSMLAVRPWQIYCDTRIYSIYNGIAMSQISKNIESKNHLSDELTRLPSH
jgi:hypothetical protein